MVCALKEAVADPWQTPIATRYGIALKEAVADPWLSPIATRYGMCFEGGSS